MPHSPSSSADLCSQEGGTFFVTMQEHFDRLSLASVNVQTSESHTDHSNVYSYESLPPLEQPQRRLPPLPHTTIWSSDEAPPSQASDDDTEGALQSEHILKWKSVRETAVIVTGTNIYIPQSLYQPYTEADRARYIRSAELKEPIIFMTLHPGQWGIALEDALKARLKDLHDRDHFVFEDCGPSVSIRLQWPGYRAWTRQIPTMDFKSPKGPITKAKLAKNIASCVKRFIEDKEMERMDTEADRRWKVGRRFIRVEDLILVSLHNISKGSWQPQLRLRTPLTEIEQRRVHTLYSAS